MRFSLDGSDWELQGWLAHEWELIKNVKVDAGNLDLSQVMFGETEWLPATVPGSVHADLVKAGEIPPPYEGMNSRLCEWVHDRMWLYRKRFVLPDTFTGERVILHLDGLDYSGRVFLDGKLVGSNHGTFVPAEFDVTAQISAGAGHELLVMVDVPPYEPGQVGYCRDVRTLRPRFSSGWDFCTRLVNVGLWSSAWLESSGPARIQELFVKTVACNPAKADIACVAVIHAAGNAHLDWHWTIIRLGKVVAQKQGSLAAPVGDIRIDDVLKLENPELWWPAAYGDQPLYEALLTVRSNGNESHTQTILFGIRKIRMLPNEQVSAGAPPYTVEVNGRRIFLQGWNWVPLDHLYGSVQAERYSWFIGLAQRAGANCLRVWGGGLIETQCFYDLCDRAGILVWQEMPQSSSGLDNEPPSNPDFLAELRRTADAALKARRNHPSLFAWGGGNELTYDGLKPLDAEHPNLKAIRQQLNEHADHLAWLPTSPFGPAFDFKHDDAGKGVHWDVHGPWKYQGTTEHYRYFNENDCLFHSETGTEACAQVTSIRKFLEPNAMWPPRKENRQWLHHAHWWVQWEPVTQLFGEQDGIERFVLASQLIQAESLRYAMEANRRRAFNCSGVLIWQFNEPWPNATATSNVDYYGTPKLGFYAMAQAMRPVMPSLRYDRLCWKAGEIFSARVFLHDDTGEHDVAEVRAQILDVAGVLLGEKTFTPGKEWVPVREVGQIALEVPPLQNDAFGVRLTTLTGRGESLTNTYLFSTEADLVPYLQLPATHLQVTRSAKGIRVRNTGRALAFCLMATCPDGNAIYFEGSGATLLPSEECEYMYCQREAGDDEIPARLEISAVNAEPVAVQ